MCFTAKLTDVEQELIEARQRVSKLEEDKRKLREALEPFARAASGFEHLGMIDNCRNAAKVLEETKDPA